ncbi:hypothetical protein NGB36_25915 [Streptomyces sp. RB6PN25]|uniref:Tyr recombinase domain-containing protein n=1 Tax=Streptomyces humicola TaxID=2953240 RepID=A0ABT1Q564_9ACTN|nr:hypothetical protein [Streptomyces humicola]MCQ4083930.1 hypothetical protein [Streptomyces humicola]
MRARPQDSGYVLVDELGRPYRTDKLRREAYKLMDAVGVRKVRLYDARHAVLSWMANNGVPDTVVSAWVENDQGPRLTRVKQGPDLRQRKQSLSGRQDLNLQPLDPQPRRHSP